VLTADGSRLHTAAPQCGDTRASEVNNWITPLMPNVDACEVDGNPGYTALPSNGDKCARFENNYDSASRSNFSHYQPSTPVVFSGHVNQQDKVRAVRQLVRKVTLKF
jgi:hypothetical protein